MGDHFPWKPEGRPVDELGWCGVRFLTPGGADAQENHRELVHPTGAVQARPECTLEMAVKSLDEPIGLWVVGRSGLVPDAQGPVQFTPKGPRKLGPSIRHYVIRHPEPGDPRADEGPNAGCRRSILKGDRFGPPGIPVDDGEQVLVAL